MAQRPGDAITALTRALCGGVACLGLAACSSITAPLQNTPRQPQHYQNERFQSDQTFSHLFDAKVDTTCEAARRALLSQGYMITRVGAGVVNSAKRFLPEGELHVEIAFTVVCVAEGKSGELSTAYVSAQQAERWLGQNRGALESSNAYVEKNGLPLPRFRNF